MPHVEVVPYSTGTSAPGWAYVPDTGIPNAAIKPGQKRNARRSAIGFGETTARQQNAILKRLADLDKDNHRDIQIPVPVRQRDAAGRVSRGKVTPGVRKILQSQKTFANHLADEEAGLSNQASQSAAASHRPPPNKVAKTPASIAKRASTPSLAKTPSKLSQSISTSSAAVKSTDSGLPVPFGPTPDDNNPLLRSRLPTPPSDAEMKELLAAPPLSYNAARAAPPASGIPARQFCEICGYWGTVRCLKCGARVCGLECKGVHDEGRCLRFYA